MKRIKIAIATLATLFAVGAIAAPAAPEAAASSSAPAMKKSEAPRQAHKQGTHKKHADRKAGTPAAAPVAK